MKKCLILGLLALGVGFFSACEKQSVLSESDNHPVIVPQKVVVGGDTDCGKPFVTSLFTEQYDFVGTVTVIQSGSELTISYEITKEGVLISETHLDVSENAAGFPITGSGNPDTGDFEFVDTFETGVSSVDYHVNIEGLTSVSIAAHAVVVYSDGTECADISTVEDLLTDSSVNLTWQYTKTDSYYNIGISNAGVLDGQYLGWCADNNWAPVHYPEATLVSSYDTSFSVLADIVDHPENLDLLNYLMNTFFKNQPFPVIQAAVWTLLNGFYDNPGGGLELTPDQEQSLKIVIEDVFTNGEGFVPACGQDMVLLINSGDSKAYQNCLILYSLPEIAQSHEEPAWGYGNPFEGESWAMYFDYCLGSTEEQY